MIRLAAVSYLNTRPLIEPIARGEFPQFRLTEDLPSRLPAQIESGEADIGLLPCGYIARHPFLSIAPGAGIACKGPVRSILLLSGKPAREWRRIAVTTSSMSSVALLGILLRQHFKVDCERTPAENPMESLRTGAADGALLIGDPALQVDPGAFRTYDLGEEWFRMTGLPFVFALWAGPDAEIAKRAAPLLTASMRQGRSLIPEIARLAAPKLNLPEGLCEDYLSHFIIHDVGPQEMSGYELFREMLNAEGV